MSHHDVEQRSLAENHLAGRDAFDSFTMGTGIRTGQKTERADVYPEHRFDIVAELSNEVQNGPVTAENDVYEAYLAFACNPGLLMVSDTKPPCAVVCQKRCGHKYYWVPVEAGPASSAPP